MLMHIVEMASSAPSVTHVLPVGPGVTAVTSLGDDVFVLRWLIWEEVEVYDAGTFTLKRCLPVRGLSHSYGLAACASNKCLYASDSNNDLIHRVDLSGSNAVARWSVGRRPAGLTVNNDKNVLVVIQDERKLQQFTTHGSLLRTIQLQPDIILPSQVIQLSSGQFVVSHTVDTQHRVCLVDDKGAVVRSYAGTRGSDDVFNRYRPSLEVLDEMNVRKGLAVDEHGNILVADVFNNRLLVFDPTLTSAREMSVSVDGGLDNTLSLWYDKSRGRLYVGERGGNRVIIIDHLKDFTATEVYSHP